MVHMVTNFKKYLKLYLKLIKFAISLDLEYRWSFVLMVVVELAFFFITIASVGVIFSNVTEVAGWNYNQMLVLLGFNMMFSEIMLGIFFIHNLRNLPELIRTGGLDLILVKPVNSQFIVSMWRPYSAMIPSLIAGLITIYWGVVGLNLNLSFINIILSFLIMILGVLIGYSIGMLFTTLSIWFIGASPLTRISEQINFMAKIPNNAFYGVWKFVFTFILPIAFMASFPAQTLVGGFKIWWLVIGLILTFIFLKTSNLFWNFALRKYSSASS